MSAMLAAPARKPRARHVRIRQSQALHGVSGAAPAMARRGRGDRCWARDFISAFVAPPDYQQGDTVKIMFLHVPAAWTAMMAYGLMALARCSAWCGAIRSPMSAAKAAAPLGALFTALGSDHRLAVGPADVGRILGVGRAADIVPAAAVSLSRLHRAVERDRGRNARRARRRDPGAGRRGQSADHRVLGRLVDTLHQGESIVRAGGPPIAAVFLWPLSLMALGYTLLFFTLWMVRIRTEILERRARTPDAGGA